MKDLSIRDGLLRHGAALVPGVLTTEELEPLRVFARGQAASYVLGPGQKDAAAAPVSPTEPEFLKAIQKGARVVAGLEFSDIRFLAGALIPKWLGEGRRGWHVDFWGWENTSDTWRETPPQVGLLIYLDDAHVDTGALLVVPGSHRRQIHGHFDYWESWKAHPEEVAIPANAGDAVILDPRAMHAVTANSRIDQRLCLTLWYLIDFDKLEAKTRSTVMLSIPPSFKELLGPLCPEFNEAPCWFPHIKKPQFPITLQRISALRNGRIDKEVVGSAAQAGDEFLETSQTYSWLFAAGAAKAPIRILELGVRYGYGSIALAKGGQWAGTDPECFGVDAEADGLSTNAIADRSLEDETGKCFGRLLKLDTKNADEVIAGLNGIGCPDIIHIDGDHSEEGIAAEIRIAVTYIKPNGLILIDDVDVVHVSDAALKLAAFYGVEPIFLPTQHGTYLIDVGKRSKHGY